MPARQNKRASVSCQVEVTPAEGADRGHAVERRGAMKMTSSSGTEHISPKKLPTCCVSRLRLLVAEGESRCRQAIRCRPASRRPRQARACSTPCCRMRRPHVLQAPAAAPSSSRPRHAFDLRIIVLLIVRMSFAMVTPCSCAVSSLPARSPTELSFGMFRYGNICSYQDICAQCSVLHETTNALKHNLSGHSMF